MRLLTAADVRSHLPLADVIDAVERALRQQATGNVERPERPHFPVGHGLDTSADTADETGDPVGTGLTMSAHVHGDETYTTKLASVHPDNPQRGLPTVQSQLLVTDAATGEPLVFAAAGPVTNRRTGAVGGLAARDLAVGDGPVTVGLLGAGTQALWQTRAVAETRGIEQLRVYSPDSRASFAAERRAEGIDAEAVAEPRAAVTDADVVLTATTATEPVFPGEALADDALVVAVGAYSAETRELDATTLDRADRVFADVPSEVAETGDVIESDLDPEAVEPFGDVATGDRDRQTDDGIVVVSSVGSAVFDAAAGDLLATRAAAAGAGDAVELS